MTLSIRVIASVGWGECEDDIYDVVGGLCGDHTGTPIAWARSHGLTRSVAEVYVSQCAYV